MRKQHIVYRPTKLSEVSFEDLYEDISSDWRLKAERLQARRWRALMHAVKGKRNPGLI